MIPPQAKPVLSSGTIEFTERSKSDSELCFWIHPVSGLRSGLQGRGVISNHQFLNAGKMGLRCSLVSNLQLGPELTVIIQENSCNDVDGNLTIGTNLDLNGKSRAGNFLGFGWTGWMAFGQGLKY